MDIYGYNIASENIAIICCIDFSLHPYQVAYWKDKLMCKISSVHIDVVFLFNFIVLMLFVIQVGTIQKEAQLTKMDLLSKASLETLPPSPPSPPTPSSTQYLYELSSCGTLLSQKLRNLELQTGESENSEIRWSTLDPSCLLTPPNTPHIIDPADLGKAYKNEEIKGDSETLRRSSDVDAHDEGTV